MYGASVLKQVLERYADENVSDEQVERVLEPVGRMIRDGRFTRRIRRRAIFRAAVSAAVAVAFGFILLFQP
jgi:hypothetical protein